MVPNHQAHNGSNRRHGVGLFLTINLDAFIRTYVLVSLQLLSLQPVDERTMGTAVGRLQRIRSLQDPMLQMISVGAMLCS